MLLTATHWQASITVTSHSVSDKGGRFVAARIVYMHIINLQLIIHYPQLHWQPQAARVSGYSHKCCLLQILISVGSLIN